MNLYWRVQALPFILLNTDAMVIFANGGLIISYDPR